MDPSDDKVEPFAEAVQHSARIAHVNVQQSLDRAREAVERCLTLAKLSEENGRTTRTFLSPPMREVHRLVRGWMETAGLKVSVDSIGNVRGSLEGAPGLLIGSHLDTVPGAGAFDGILGVMLGISLAEACSSEQRRPGIEVLGFSEEEGVRFGVPFLGSRAVAGTLNSDLLNRKDARGLTVTDAIREFGLDPGSIRDAEFCAKPVGYLELHIEQGPVLDSLNMSVGVVTAIVGQTRIEVTFRGKTNHAGTTPMHLRRDSLTAASEWVVAVEREASSTPGLVATVGSISALPGAANVIPGETRATLDVRHADDSVRTGAVNRILAGARAIGEKRGVEAVWETRLEQAAVRCDSALTGMMARAVASAGYAVHHMVSGAGHDAMVMAARMPVAMLFIRSPEGISHHSAETVRVEDVAAALRVGYYFLKEVALQHA
jgi:allantoate deiminase